MIVITGGAGFIGSALIWRLNQEGYSNIVVVDHLGSGEKWKNLAGLSFKEIYHKDEFYRLIVEERLPFNIEACVHLGACSSTTEKDADYLVQNNLRYSQELVKYCLPRRARFIYASSAATYGAGESGYLDDEARLESLIPLNMYGFSKHMFDLWIKRNELLGAVVGLKFFNVYGPNEYHKGDMRSVIVKAYNQIKAEGKVKLFKSYKSEYADGFQMRDFVYVKDVVNAIVYFLHNKDNSGIYNLGQGKARSWNDLAQAIFSAIGIKPKIEYIDMPETLRGKYQYFTEANITKLRGAGFGAQMHSLESGVDDYVKNYLAKDQYLGGSKF